MPLPAHYATTPCRDCGAPVIWTSAVDGRGGHHKVALDQSVPVFVRMRDGDGGALWAKDTSGELLAQHRAVCPAQSSNLRREPI